MLRPALFVALLSTALLAGCSGSPDDAASASAAPSPTFTVTALSPQAAVLTTDTYHLLDRPYLTSRAPTAQEPIRVPIDSFFGQTVSGAAAKSFQDTWNTTLPEDVRGFVGNATLVVEVTGSLVTDPRTSVQGPGCFWALSMVSGSPETGTYHDLGCVNAAGTVAAGLYRLEFPFTLADVTLPQGTEIHFELHTQEPLQRAPGSAAELLTASIPYDSMVQVFGLHLPLDPDDLLGQATTSTTR